MTPEDINKTAWEVWARARKEVMCADQVAILAAALLAAEKRCPRFGKWFGCKFEPRYDKGIPDLAQFTNVERITGDALEAFRPVTYIHDICIRCGKTVLRAGASS